MTHRYVTRSFHALAQDFHIVSECEGVGEYLEAVVSGFPLATRETEEYLVRRSDDEPTKFELVFGDAVVASSTSVGHLGGSLVHDLNRHAISADYAVMSHAGGVELDGVGFVFPAHMESGKTTLTAGLVRAGFAYLTDEAVAFDWESGVIEPYPKPLSIDAGSQFLFPELEPAPAPGDERAPEDQWQVPADAIRPGAIGEPCRARYVVFPSYRAGATTELVAMSPAEGLLELATNTFEFRDHPRRSLETLGGVVRDAECFRLTVGDLRDACMTVAELAGAQERFRV